MPPLPTHRPVNLNSKPFVTQGNRHRSSSRKPSARPGSTGNKAITHEIEPIVRPDASPDIAELSSSPSPPGAPMPTGLVLADGRQANDGPLENLWVHVARNRTPSGLSMLVLAPVSHHPSWAKVNCRHITLAPVLDGAEPVAPMRAHSTAHSVMTHSVTAHSMTHQIIHIPIATMTRCPTPQR